ncbi:MAG: glycosyltransferase [Oscillospiraceae bacterium]|jgi:glycosyltransferase involved in cell wall biosynthesis|nr:glycosyltransferase [Oscillospiraceae bacterium]
MTASVLLPAYCGERFLAAQLDSILPQLREGDELLLSDDSPPDQPETRRIAEAYAARDARVRVLEGPKRGVIRNVEFLLTRAGGDFLLLADQDDVWLPGKLAAICAALEAGAGCVLHDAKIVDETLAELAPSFLTERRAAPGFWRNFWRNGYIGCCMGFRAALLPDLLPFPAGIPMHDQWIGLTAERRAACQTKQASPVVWLREPYLLYRRHGAAQTGGGTSLRQKLRWRVRLFWALLRRPEKQKEVEERI